MSEHLLERVEQGVASLDAGSKALLAVDVSRHNGGSAPPDFDNVVSQTVSATQFEHPDFQRIAQLLTGCREPLPWTRIAWPLGQLHRKLWEWCFIVKAAEQHGKLRPGLRAVGFGVGTEPLPAAFASFGLDVLATDLEPDASGPWVETLQHMNDLGSLSKPYVVSDEELDRRVQTGYVDMNSIPSDLGSYDVLWSSGSFEHLGSPQAGLEFVRRALRHLEPGGIAVHTTEFELTRRGSTADYGHLAVYRIDDLDWLKTTVLAEGYEMLVNWHVSFETPEDRIICIPPYPPDDPAHLKLSLGESVSTSVGILISNPTQ